MKEACTTTVMQPNNKIINEWLDVLKQTVDLAKDEVDLFSKAITSHEEKYIGIKNALKQDIQDIRESVITMLHDIDAVTNSWDKKDDETGE